jgi:hypothetical protein
MRELVYHTRRYLAWSAFGIVLFAVPALPFLGGDQKYGWLLIIVGFGGSIFVFIRAVVGAVTGWPARRADRATAKGIGRFFAGTCVGFFVALLFLIVGKERLFSERLLPSRWGSHPLAWILAGGIATLLTDAVIQLRNFRLFVPIMWITAYAGIMSAYFALAR